MNKADLKLDWCSHEAAKYACEKWHYSGSIPTPPYNRIGVWELGQFIGCVLFSRGAARRGPDQFDLAHTEFCELTRVALTTHETPVSKILAVALKFLKTRCPGIRLIVSYADPNNGHHGGIYQAGGWIFVGQSGGTTEYIAPDGKQWHSRMISPTGKKKVYGQYRAVWKPDQCTIVRLEGKLKYLMPLDPEMRARILPLAKPYPKRVRSVDSDTPANHAGEGGANPTRTLSNSEVKHGS